jgi:D-xylose 1-dehydrogenase (NADP+, D-xylono-1,5-lactone-forming)
MARKLRWGILGTARINRSIVGPLGMSPRNELVGIASRSLDRAREYAAEKGIPRAYGSYEDMLADREIDVVYNPLPNHMHAEWTIRACQAGKHVLCEKPITMTPEELDLVGNAARNAGVVVAEAFMYRHHPQTLAVLDMISSGRLGQVKVLKGQFSFTMSRPNNFRMVPEFGGGSIWDVGCYPVSFSRAIAGTKPAEVFAWQTLSSSGVDDVFVAQMRYPNGIIAQIVSGFALPYQVWFEIQGSDAVLKIPSPWKPKEGDYAVLFQNDKEEKITFPNSELYLGEVEDMADAVLTGTPPRISLEESRENITTLNALVESAQKGCAVRL